MQHEHCARTAGELHERGVEVDACVDLAGRRPRAKGGVVALDQPRCVALGRSQLLEDDVHAESMEPRRQRALAAERRQPLPRPNEDVLYEIDRLTVASDHSATEPEDGRRVGAVERLECLDVALLCAANDVIHRIDVAHRRHRLGRCVHASVHVPAGIYYRFAASASVESISFAPTGRGSSPAQSTSSMITIGAASPSRGPLWMIRV